VTGARLRAWSQQRSARFADPAPATPVASLATVLATPSSAFDLELLQTDPLYRRLSPDDASRAIAAAIHTGSRRAQFWGPPCDPRAIARALDLDVTVETGSNRFGSVFQCAEYQSRPPRIIIYWAAMELLRGFVCKHALAPVLGLEDPEPIYLAHEIYHHLDVAAPVARAVEVTTLRVGPLRIRSDLASLREIGAAAFAAEVTGLRCHPRVLDQLARLALGDGPLGD